MSRHKQSFTLVELLAVICILGVLAALVVGLGAQVSKWIGTRKTVAVESILQSAVETYNTTEGYYPTETTPIPPLPTNSKAFGYLMSNGEANSIAIPDNDWAAANRNLGLWNALNPAAAINGPSGPDSNLVTIRNKALSVGPDYTSSFVDPSGVQWNLFLDGFGKWMDYRDSLGAGGKPVIISFGMYQDSNTVDQNNHDMTHFWIYSDGRGQ